MGGVDGGESLRRVGPGMLKEMIFHVCCKFQTADGCTCHCVSGWGNELSHIKMFGSQSSILGVISGRGRAYFFV